MADAAAAPPAPEGSYQPGEMKFNASVSAEYDLVVSQVSTAAASAINRELLIATVNMIASLTINDATGTYW